MNEFTAIDELLVQDSQCDSRKFAHLLFMYITKILTRGVIMVLSSNGYAVCKPCLTCTHKFACSAPECENHSGDSSLAITDLSFSP